MHNKHIKALRDLSEALKNTFTKVFFFFDFKLTELIQNEQNADVSKHFTKLVEPVELFSPRMYR